MNLHFNIHKGGSSSARKEYERTPVKYQDHDQKQLDTWLLLSSRWLSPTCVTGGLGLSGVGRISSPFVES